MDLALAFGTTVAELEDRITVAEWNLWRRYHGRQGLPFRRLEMHLAQIAQFIAVTAGGAKTGAPLSEFLIDPRDDTAATEDDNDDDAFADGPIDGVRYIAPGEE